MIPLYIGTDGARRLTTADFSFINKSARRFAQRRGQSLICGTPHSQATEPDHDPIKFKKEDKEADLPTGKERGSDNTNPPGGSDDGTTTQNKIKDPSQEPDKQLSKNKTTQLLAAVSGLSTVGSVLAHFTNVFGEDKKDFAQYGLDFFTVLGWTLTTSSALAPTGEADDKSHKHHNIN